MLIVEDRDQVRNAGECPLPLLLGHNGILFGSLQLGDIVVCDNHALDAVVERSVGQCGADIPGAVDPDLFPHWCQILQHGLSVGYEIGSQQFLGHIDDLASHIGRYKLYQLSDCGCVSFHPEAVVKEYGGDVCASKEVVKVVVRFFLLLDLGLELCVDSNQLFVQGLELFP